MFSQCNDAKRIELDAAKVRVAGKGCGVDANGDA
jgi:hypothetical protein